LHQNNIKLKILMINQMIMLISPKYSVAYSSPLSHLENRITSSLLVQRFQKKRTEKCPACAGLIDNSRFFNQ
ncbi:hypothetical protein CGH22_24945, partial [Vibrio parahaemolyticus]